MPYCGENSLVKTEGRTKTGILLRCRSWGCPDCSPERRKQLQAVGHAGTPEKFLTLTSRRVDGQSPIHAAEKLAHAWRLIRKRILRRWRLDALPFLAVFEKTKTGWPHLHILLRGPYLDQQWISDQMRELTNSPIVHIASLTTKALAVFYVTKYIGKDPERFGTTKRYWQSRDWQAPAPKYEKPKTVPGCGWERFATPIKKIARGWHELGWLVKWESARCATAELPP